MAMVFGKNIDIVERYIDDIDAQCALSASFTYGD